MKILEKNNNPTIVLGFLAIFYAVGLVGFVWEVHPDFGRLTPLNLLLSLTVVVISQQNWTRGQGLILVFAAFYGFFVEVLGVATGAIFGTYWYGDTLGFKVFETPVSMAINWVLTAYCATMTVNEWKPDALILTKSLIAAALMTSLDVLIEPVAMEQDFWQWKDGIVPIQNYVGWFLVSIPLQFLLFTFFKKQQNRVGFGVLVLQFLFFAILNIFVK